MPRMTVGKQTVRDWVKDGTAGWNDTAQAVCITVVVAQAGTTMSVPLSNLVGISVADTQAIDKEADPAGKARERVRALLADNLTDEEVLALLHTERAKLPIPEQPDQPTLPGTENVSRETPETGRYQTGDNIVVKDGETGTERAATVNGYAGDMVGVTFADDETAQVPESWCFPFTDTDDTPETESVPVRGGTNIPIPDAEPTEPVTGARPNKRGGK